MMAEAPQLSAAGFYGPCVRFGGIDGSPLPPTTNGQRQAVKRPLKWPVSGAVYDAGTVAQAQPPRLGKAAISWHHGVCLGCGCGPVWCGGCEPLVAGRAVLRS